ncbi:MAG: phosphoglycerate dehydrogenase [Gammaproteobacteria bacterium]|nr:phosphoglycerate dehydrogenase [Gammaproteobacteria bacterium]
MTTLDELKAQRAASLKATESGPPARTSNQFFGVGPITNMTRDEVERRAMRFQFEAWLEKNYRKVDDRGQPMGPITPGEMERSMHRGYPADKVVVDMMREIHRYFGFPKKNNMAVGLGGGHNGFTVAVMHLMNPNDPSQHIFVDTPKVETSAADAGGFFRQSWGTQILELQKFAPKGDVERVHFTGTEGNVPTADELVKMGIKLFVGVGHETTGATTYSEADVRNLLAWLDKNPKDHHALIDGTSLLGAMPWPEDLVQQVLSKACFFMPFQKAVGGIAGYFTATFTPEALAMIENNVQTPGWAIPRHLKLSAPKNAKLPLTGDRSTSLGPIYDAQNDKMLGGIINTFSNTAFAETTFGLLSMEQRVGSAKEMNKQSVINRQTVADWVSKHPLFELGVKDETRRGTAVTLLKVVDASVKDPAVHAKIIAKSKQFLSYEGLTHPNGDYEPGLDTARYINAFPNTPGDYRAWIGGARPQSDIVALLDNLEYAYHRAKIVVLEEALAAQGVKFEAGKKSGEKTRKDDPSKAYKVLIADLVAMKFGRDGKPDASEVRAHIESLGGVFHNGPASTAGKLEAGTIHFFYQPDLSREDEILAQTDKGQYDALIAAATFIPKVAVFNEGGVRIGAGTGNMGSDSWGGGNGKVGKAPLMNTPSFNSRATAQMAFKALLRVMPDLNVDELHRRVVEGNFDTGKNLKEYPTEKLEGKRMAVLGYGNIGREMARIAKAFGMHVVVHARPKYKDWIESEGNEFAATAEDAAKGADVISPHVGLGALDAASGRYANQGLLNDKLLSALNDGAIIVNYDRGELVDGEALAKALASGKVRYVCVDADMFVDGSGKVTGPIVPYRELEKRFPGKLELLPHAAADTEHVSRVQGAKQAVDQIVRAIRFREVVNLKGDVPAGYTDVGSHTVPGVGKVSANRMSSVAGDKELAKKLRALSENLTAFWSAIDSTEDPARRAELIERHAAKFVSESNRYITLIGQLGLKGPYN